MDDQIKSKFKIQFDIGKSDMQFYYILPIIELIYHPMSFNNLIELRFRWFHFYICLDIFLKVSEKTTDKRMTVNWKKSVRNLFG